MARAFAGVAIGAKYHAAVSSIPTILHADMDAFYAAIEQLDRPELRGKPVIVGGSGPRQVVSTASYEARKHGVHSAMPGARAQRLCPQGVFVAPRMARYAEVSAQVQAIFERFTDMVEPLSLDEAFLDVTGSRKLFGDGVTIARRIKGEVLAATQLSVSVGVATSKFVAKVASDLDKPDGLVVVAPGDERKFLAPLPLKRLWGVGASTLPRLERVGLRRIGDLQARSCDELIKLFGDHLGQHLFVLANGLDARRVEGERTAKSIGHELTFAEDLTSPQAVRDVLLQLADMVGRRLRRARLRATVVRLKLRHPPFETLSRQRSVAATDDDVDLFRCGGELLERAWDQRRGVRLLGLTGASLVSAQDPQQGGLFAPPPPERSRLLQALDAIRDRHGDSAVHRGSRRPPR